MRKPLIIVGAIVGAIILIAAGVFFYAASNLNSIISENREYLLARVSGSLGRPVEVSEIKATLGWGVTADLTGVKIADDPDFSDQPFVSASDVYANLELIPLLSREIRVRSVVLQQPEIRIVRTRNGELNVSTIGKKNEQEAANETLQKEKGKKGAAGQSALSEEPQKSQKAAKQLPSLVVHDFSIQKGQVTYVDASGPPLTLSQIDLDIKHFSFDSPFDFALAMAAFSDQQNISVKGNVGPIARNGRIDASALPLDLQLHAGPVALAELRKFEFAKAIPPKLEVSDKISLDASAKGRLDNLAIHGASDLSSNQIAFGDSFQKPSGTKLTVDVDASREGSAVGVSQAKIALGDLDVKATKISFGGGAFSGRVDTNRFDIASLTKFAPSAAKLGVTGKGEIHSDLTYAEKKPSANGVVSLAEVTIPRAGQNGNAITGLSGDIRLAGQAADVGPLAFKVGSGSATLKAHSDPIYPPKATYEFTADALRTADFSPKRPADEQLNQIKANGTFSMESGVIADNNKLTSPNGSLNNIAYSGLTVVSSLAGKNLRVSQLQIGAFGGTISANANAVLDNGGPFNASATMSNLNIQQALESQKAKAAGTVRGLLSGRLQISGKNNGDFDAIKPTLAGNGQAQVAQGKLVGVNLGAEVFKKTDNLPMIGSLIPESIARNHPELFSSPDTDFQQMGLTFVLQGTRITTHDLLLKTVDYSLGGDGWFDMDKNVDMTARILLTQQLTKEIIEQKKNVVYVTNNQNQIDIPLRVTGQLPKPRVLPDVTELAQRATQRAAQEQGRNALQKALGGNKGIGKFLGGIGGDSNTPGGGSSPSSNPPSNPLNQLKGLFGR